MHCLGRFNDLSTDIGKLSDGRALASGLDILKDSEACPEHRCGLFRIRMVLRMWRQVQDTHGSLEEEGEWPGPWGSSRGSQSALHCEPSLCASNGQILWDKDKHLHSHRADYGQAGFVSRWRTRWARSARSTRSDKHRLPGAHSGGPARGWCGLSRPQARTCWLRRCKKTVRWQQDLPLFLGTVKKTWRRRDLRWYRLQPGSGFLVLGCPVLRDGVWEASLWQWLGGRSHHFGHHGGRAVFSAQVQCFSAGKTLIERFLTKNPLGAQQGGWAEVKDHQFFKVKGDLFRSSATTTEGKGKNIPSYWRNHASRAEELTDEPWIIWHQHFQFSPTASDSRAPNGASDCAGACERYLEDGEKKKHSDLRKWIMACWNMTKFGRGSWTLTSLTPISLMLWLEDLWIQVAWSDQDVKNILFCGFLMGITPLFIHLPLGFFSIKIAIHFKGPVVLRRSSWRSG